MKFLIPLTVLLICLSGMGYCVNRLVNMYHCHTLREDFIDSGRIYLMLVRSCGDNIACAEDTMKDFEKYSEIYKTKTNELGCH